MKLQSFVGGLAAAGLVALALPAPAHGGSGGMRSGASDAGQSRGGHYLNPFWSPGYPGSGSYDVGYTYTYTPSPEQQSTARKRISDYLIAVRKGKRRAPTHRYVCLETLRPTRAQSEEYLKKRAENGATRTNHAQLHCLIVFDTQTHQSVGTGCYVVESLPTLGAVTKFESVSAEFVGQGSL
ncbi:MAG TPA: hypothetical protein VE860_23900 [Chthoniobacterales bacterium]|nr:hypothetical protein [Chthoniobacterales bacterium]